MEEGVQDKDRQFVNALAQGLEILRAFRARRTALTARDLAESTHLPRQAVLRLTNTLVELRCLTSDGATGAFSLAPGVLSLGYRVLASADIAERATPILEALARTTDCVAALTSLDRADVIIQRICTGDTAVSVNASVGLRVPFAQSASGAVILAASSEKRRSALLEELRAAHTRGEFAEIAEAVERGVEEFGKRGYCTMIGGWSPEVMSIAAPVICAEGEAKFAVAIGAPMSSGSADDWVEAQSEKVVDAARRLSFCDPTEGVV